jgi:hypothetical protein
MGRPESTACGVARGAAREREEKLGMGFWRGQPLFDPQWGEWGMYVTSVDRDPESGVVHYLSEAAPVSVSTKRLLTREQALAAGAPAPGERRAEVAGPEGEEDVAVVEVEWEVSAGRDLVDEQEEGDGL